MTALTRDSFLQINLRISPSSTFLCPIFNASALAECERASLSIIDGYKHDSGIVRKVSSEMFFEGLVSTNKSSKNLI